MRTHKCMNTDPHKPHLRLLMIVYLGIQRFGDLLIQIWNKNRWKCWCVFFVLHMCLFFNVRMIWLCVKIWREKTVTFVNTPAQCMHINTHVFSPPPSPLTATGHWHWCHNIIYNLSLPLACEISLSSLWKENEMKKQILLYKVFIKFKILTPRQKDILLFIILLHDCVFLNKTMQTSSTIISYIYQKKLPNMCEICWPADISFFYENLMSGLL